MGNVQNTQMERRLVVLGGQGLAAGMTIMDPEFPCGKFNGKETEMFGMRQRRWRHITVHAPGASRSSWRRRHLV